jgi:hypothetical protein
VEISSSSSKAVFPKETILAKATELISSLIPTDVVPGEVNISISDISTPASSLASLLMVDFKSSFGSTRPAVKN